MKLTLELTDIQERMLQEYLHTHRLALATSQAIKYKSDPAKYRTLEPVAVLYDSGVYAPFVGIHGSDVQYVLTPCALGTRIEAQWMHDNVSPIDLTNYTNW